MVRQSYDCTAVNNPKTIAGVEWKIVVAVCAFFGYGAVLYRVPYLVIPPLILLAFLRGPGVKDPMFLRIYLRHRSQRDRYSPHYLCQPNVRSPRPRGFGRQNWF
jgi:hypothetical protein